MKIENEIQQSKFTSAYQKAAINILFTASWMNKINSETLKSFNISIQQFNVLRILKGMNPEPATVKILTERMLDKMSNASRLVDKLVAKGLAERESNTKDRRQVDVMITQLGLVTVTEASVALESLLYSRMKNITDEQANQLSEYLDQMRG